MRRDDPTLVADMLRRVRRIRAKTAGVPWEQFRDDEDLHDIVERSISVIGEAANRLSPEFKEVHAEVPWREVISMRHRVVHGYFEVNQAVVWAVVHEELPALEILLSSLIEE